MMASRSRFAQRLRRAGATLAPRPCQICPHWRHIGSEVQICATFAPRWRNVGASAVPDLPNVGATLASRSRFAQRLRHAGATLAPRRCHICHVGATVAVNVGATLASRRTFAQRFRNAGTRLAPRRCHICQHWRHIAFETHICTTFAPRWRNVGATFGSHGVG